MNFDSLDNRLINTLLNNSRGSFRSLGEELDITVSTVSNRVKALESKGVINRYTPVINYSKLGYKLTAIIYLKVEGVKITEIVDKLRNQKRMICVYEISGSYDFITIGKFKDIEEMDDHIKKLLADVDIQETNTSIVLNIIDENDQFDLDID